MRSHHFSKAGWPSLPHGLLVDDDAHGFNTWRWRFPATKSRHFFSNIVVFYRSVSCFGFAQYVATTLLLKLCETLLLKPDYLRYIRSGIGWEIPYETRSGFARDSLAIPAPVTQAMPGPVAKLRTLLDLADLRSGSLGGRSRAPPVTSHAWICCRGNVCRVRGGGFQRPQADVFKWFLCSRVLTMQYIAASGGCI